LLASIISNRGEFKQVAQNIYKSITEGKCYNFSFEEVKQAKTFKQLGFIFGGLVKTLHSFYLEETGEDYPIEILKELLYEVVGIDEIIYLPTGKKIIHRKSLSKMTKEEASEFINKSILWIDENTECILPSGLRYCWTAHVTDEEINNVMSNPIQERDDYYLQKIRQLNCIYCGKPHAQAHHIKKGWYAKGIKPPDYMAIPLCEDCHIPIAHTKGEEYLLNGLKNVLNGLDIEIFCRLLYHRIYDHRN